MSDDLQIVGELCRRSPHWLITPEKKVMFYPLFVCLSVSLSVCLSASRIKILLRIYLWTGKIPLNVASHLHRVSKNIPDIF